MANIIIGLVLSFFIAGLGIAYAGNMELGIGLVLLWLMVLLIALYSTGFLSLVCVAFGVLIWIYSIIATFFLTIES